MMRLITIIAVVSISVLGGCAPPITFTEKANGIVRQGTLTELADNAGVVYCYDVGTIRVVNITDQERNLTACGKPVYVKGNTDLVLLPDGEVIGYPMGPLSAILREDRSCRNRPICPNKEVSATHNGMAFKFSYTDGKMREMSVRRLDGLWSSETEYHW